MRLTIQDIRNTVLGINEQEKISLVRVSDTYWVYLRNGKPEIAFSHDDVIKLFNSIDEGII